MGAENTSAQTAQAAPPAAPKKQPAAWATGGWAEPVRGTTATARALRVQQNDGTFPNQPAVRTEYRNTSTSAGWADPAKSASSVRVQPQNTELYPSQPAVGSSYRNSGARGGWVDKAR